MVARSLPFGLAVLARVARALISRFRHVWRTGDGGRWGLDHA
jgi:hypothetical protein